MKKTIYCSISVVLMSCLVNACVNKSQLLMPTTPPHYQLKEGHTRAGKPIVLMPACPQVYNNKGEFDVTQNFGCSTSRNLGLMIADPNDVHRPKKNLVYQAHPFTQAIEKQRMGKSSSSNHKGLNNVNKSLVSQ